MAERKTRVSGQFLFFSKQYVGLVTFSSFQLAQNQVLHFNIFYFSHCLTLFAIITKISWIMPHVHVWCGQLVGADLSSVCLLGDHSWNLQGMLWLFCSFWSVLYLHLKIMSSCSHLSLVLILNHFNLIYYFLLPNYRDTSEVT